MKRLVLAVALLSLMTACAGQLAWRRADGSYDRKQLEEDIDACETYTRVAEDKESEIESSARAYGDWGNSYFDYCMRDKKWRLMRVSSEATAAGPSAKA